MRPDVKLTSLEVGLIELKSCVGGSMIFWELRDINLNPQKPVFFRQKNLWFCSMDFTYAACNYIVAISCCT